jgi:DNA invertase Pin-like site-specific DNA recombinase
MESGVDFVAVDQPFANKLTIHILAAVAEHERELISNRIMDALAAAKACGVKPGSPKLAEPGLHPEMRATFCDFAGLPSARGFS